MAQAKLLSGSVGNGVERDRNVIAVTVGVVALLIIGGWAITAGEWAIMAGFSLLYLLSFATRIRWPQSAVSLSVVEPVVVALAVLLLSEAPAASVYLAVSPIAASAAAGAAGVGRATALQLAVFTLASITSQALVLAPFLWTLGGGLLGLLVVGVSRWVDRVTSRHAVAAAQNERKFLAAEIHDGLAQELAVLAFQLDGLQLQHGEQVPSAEVDRVAAELRRTMYDVRLTIHGLRDSQINEVGLAPVLAEHVRRCAEISGITAHLSISADADRLPPEVTVELAKIAQEAITNVRKHSKAKNVWVSADVLGGHALLVVADDGRGISSAGVTDPLTGYGMSIIKERAQRIDADLTVRSRDGGGTVIEVSRESARGRLPGSKLLGSAGSRSKSSPRDRRRMSRDSRTFS
jgi:signal transduction histidine kinase